MLWSELVLIRMMTSKRESSAEEAEATSFKQLLHVRTGRRREYARRGQRGAMCPAFPQC